ncbi:MAG: sulfate adenylyltransferase subunit CysN [Candidatus Hydrogenedentota bacterium]|nr:MAG: sulfate adenylyltransferase subunit CysN [Candidatus Hydrogenedentota bacterium]
MKEEVSPPQREIQLLRFTTAGSVDDGKSTLIGRLLYDSKSIFEDQMEALERSSDLTGAGRINLANLTDGLRAEREQGITIDVAYRYFSTPRRRFIIADTPGHEQYTRNMVTGASTANLAVILVDARKGVVTQTKRHTIIASLLQIPHIVLAVNKMDLVGYDEDVFRRIQKEFREFSGGLGVRDVRVIPISALEGDNVVERSTNMPWYQGPPLLEYLERLHFEEDRNLKDFRFPVQYVIRDEPDFRGFAGSVASGVVHTGDRIVVLPSRIETRVRGIATYDGEREEAFCPQAVTLLLDDEIDISRGSMFVHPDNLPTVASEFDAVICWMNESPLNLARKYYIKHTTLTVLAKIQTLFHRLDVNDLSTHPADTLALNEIGKVRIRTAKPLFFDPYRGHRQTGSFILIDPATNATLAGGMIEQSSSD